MFALARESFRTEYSSISSVSDEETNQDDTIEEKHEKDLKPTIESDRYATTISANSPDDKTVPQHVHDFFERVFDQSPTLTTAQANLLSRYFRLSSNKVTQWFRNRRRHVLRKEQERVRGQHLRNLRRPRYVQNRLKSYSADPSLANTWNRSRETLMPFVKHSSRMEVLIKDWVDDHPPQDATQESQHSSPIQPHAHSQYDDCNNGRDVNLYDGHLMIGTAADISSNYSDIIPPITPYRTKPQYLSFGSNSSVASSYNIAQTANAFPPRSSIVDAHGNFFSTENGHYYQRQDQARTLHWGLPKPSYDDYSQVRLSPTWEPITNVLAQDQLQQRYQVPLYQSDVSIEINDFSCYNISGQIYASDVIDPATGSSQVFFSPPFSNTAQNPLLQRENRSTQDFSMTSAIPISTLHYYEDPRGQISSFPGILDVNPMVGSENSFCQDQDDENDSSYLHLLNSDLDFMPNACFNDTLPLCGGDLFHDLSFSMTEFRGDGGQLDADKLVGEGYGDFNDGRNHDIEVNNGDSSSDDEAEGDDSVFYYG